MPWLGIWKTKKTLSNYMLSVFFIQNCDPMWWFLKREMSSSSFFVTKQLWLLLPYTWNLEQNCGDLSLLLVWLKTPLILKIDFKKHLLLPPVTTGVAKSTMTWILKIPPNRTIHVCNCPPEHTSVFRSDAGVVCHCLPKLFVVKVGEWIVILKLKHSLCCYCTICWHHWIR